MDPIEDELKGALLRKPAPPGLASGVFKRIESESWGSKPLHGIFAAPFWRIAAALVLLMDAGTGIIGYRQYIQARNEEALHRTLTALNITAVRLDEAKQKAFEQKRLGRISRVLAEIQSADGK